MRPAALARQHGADRDCSWPLPRPMRRRKSEAVAAIAHAIPIDASLAVPVQVVPHPFGQVRWPLEATEEATQLSHLFGATLGRLLEPFSGFFDRNGEPRRLRAVQGLLDLAEAFFDGR